MTAHVRPLSKHDAWSFEGMDRRKVARPLSFLPDRNFGGASASFGLQSLHHFFSQAGKTDPHTRLSSLVLRRKETVEEKRLTMDQKTFAKKANAIKPADLVDEAASWAARLTKEAEAETGKTDAALETVARQTGVNESTLWRLRYRKPKDLAVSVYMKLKAAIEVAEKRQNERINHGTQVARSLGVANSDVLLRTANSVVTYRTELVAGTINNVGSDD